MSEDTRIAYGARCTWFGSIHDVSTNRSGLPACPHCRGVLFEMQNEAEWWDAVDKYEREHEPGYRALWEWARGRCFRDMDALRAAYKIAHPPALSRGDV